MNFDKNLIAKNFSRGAKTYDEVAQVQFAAAGELVELVEPYLQKDSRILDLGSGTSFIAKKILSFDKFRMTKITEVDLASEMLRSWSERPSNVETIVADFENLPFEENNFDLILSSFSLQWSSDFARNFSQYFSLLKPNGIFAFCLPIAGSLPELADFNINELPTNYLLKNSLEKSGFKQKFFVEKIVSQNFLNNRDLLKFLKKIGADSPLKTQLPLKNGRSKNIGSQLSWHIAYFLCAK